jgi:hypothetical protein
MAKIRFETSIKFDVLGKWQQPIIEAVKEALPGSEPGYTALPQGRAGLIVYWKGFKGRDVPERQEMVRNAVGSLGPEVAKKISLILALTREEADGLGGF